MLKIGQRVICVKADPISPLTKLMTITTVIDVEPWYNDDNADDLAKREHYAIRVAGTNYRQARDWPRFWRKIGEWECSCQFRPIDEVPKKEKKRKPQTVGTLQVVLVGIPAGQQIVPGSIRIR